MSRVKRFLILAAVTVEFLFLFSIAGASLAQAHWLTNDLGYVFLAELGVGVLVVALYIAWLATSD